MGVTGLLRVLKSASEPCSIEAFRGQTVGIDGYSWLHKGAIACAWDLAYNKPTVKHLEYCLRRIRMLRHFGVEPYMVFDGDFLPTKANVEKEREKSRRQARAQGLLAVKRGDRKQAQDYFQKSIDITPNMVAQLIEMLKQEKVKYVVAPYEADAQLVYLEKNNYISAIISEDSDLLVFGAEVLLTKLTDFGECVCVARKNFGKCTDLFLHDLTDTQFRAMAIFSGCDYSNGIPKVGLKVAHRFLRKFTTPERALRGFRYEGYNVPSDFDSVFEQAELTFLHQRVFCLAKRKLVMLNEPNMELTDLAMEYIGRDIDPDIAEGIALGVTDPFTKKPFSRIAALPVLATTSASLPAVPSPSTGSNRKITSFFQKASHSSSSPTLDTSPLTRYSIPQGQKPSLPLSHLSLTQENKSLSTHGRSLVVKRAHKLFNSAESVGKTELKNSEPVIEAASSQSMFVSKFFEAVKPEVLTHSQSLPASLDNIDDESSDDDFGTIEDESPDLDKENSFDSNVIKVTPKRKLNLNRFAYQHFPAAGIMKQTKNQTLNQVSSEVMWSDFSETSDLSEIETPEKVRIQKAECLKRKAAVLVANQGSSDAEEEIMRSPSRRQTKKHTTMMSMFSPPSNLSMISVNSTSFQTVSAGTPISTSLNSPAGCGLSNTSVRRSISSLEKFKYNGKS